VSLDAAGWLRRSEAFASLDDEQLALLASCAEVGTLTRGETIHEAGEAWDAMYFLLAGELDILNGDIVVDTLREGARFGDSLLGFPLADPLRVISTAPTGSVLRLGRDRFESAIAKRIDIAAHLDAYSRRAVLEHSQLFASLPPEKLSDLVASTRRQSLRAGEVVMREGDEADSMVIVEQGRLRVVRGAAAHVIQVLHAGEIAGEISLVTGNRRNASVIADSDASLLVIAKRDFLRVVEGHASVARSLDQILRERGVERAAEASAVLGPRASRPPSSDSGTNRDSTPRAGGTPALPGKTLADRLGRFPSVRQQSSMDCGAACLATVCRYYGKRVSLNQVREIARVGRAGASMYNIMRAAGEMGFECEPMKSTWDDLRSHKLPAIVNWGGYHWIVVFKMTDDRVTVADPGFGVTTHTKAEFLENWTRYTIFLEPNEGFESVEEAPPTLRQFVPYIVPHTRAILEMTGASAAIQLLSIIVPLFTKFIVDEVIVKQRANWLPASFAAAIILTMLQLVVSFSRQELMFFVSARVILVMTADFYSHLLSLPLSFFEKRKVGDVTSRLQESTTITTFLTQEGLQSVLDLGTAFLYVGLMLYFDVPLTLVALAFVLLHLTNIYLITPRMQQSFRDVFQRKADSESFVIEAVRGLGTIKTLGIEHPTRWTMEDLVTSFTNAFFRSMKYAMASGLIASLIDNLSSIAVLFIGALMVLHKSLTLGELLAFTLLSRSLSAPLMKLVGFWDRFQQALNSVERLNDVFESRPEVLAEQRETLLTVPRVRGHIAFERVTFRYESEEKNVVQNVTLEIEPGSKVAFVGRSGSGKSTMIKLLCGLYAPTTGSIHVDGFSLSDVWMPSLRGQIGVVPQQSALFSATVRMNIAKSRPNATLAEVTEAAKLAGAHEFIARLPRGYDSVVEENGANFSGGQRQRIAIARAFLQEPRILILDEATSALDNESERFIQYNIEQAFRDRTTLMIAHRLSTVRNADRIVVMDRGTILEQGTHDQLVSARGLYYFLSTQQLNL
jgi:HlyB family type I secretion system ABC transporter